MPELPLTITGAAAALRSGELTAVELTSALLARIDAADAALGAFVTVLHDEALAAAAVADAELAAGRDRGSLQGIPLAVKDIIATRDAPTAANSRVRPAGIEPGVDAPVVARLRAAGAVVIGKSTTFEYAIGSPDPATGFPVPRNPWNLAHTPAGSSAGTGIAVAAGLALGGLGTDTGGSVRGPAALTGHTGLKTTYGRVPKSGVVPLGFSLDSVGPMARSAHDCALLLGAIAGADPTDPTTADVPVPDYLAAMGPGLAGLRVGVARPYFFDADGLDPDVARLVLDAADVLREIGARVVDVEIPHAELAKDANVITSRSEAFANHRADLVARWHDYGRHTRPLLAQGALMNAGDYVAVQRFRSVFRRSLAAVLADVDVIVTPTMPTPAARADVADSIASRMAAPNFMAQWNLAGVPALAVPAGAAPSGLPVSMQLVGRPFAEARLLAVADAYQRATRWHLAVPALPAAAGPAAA